MHLLSKQNKQNMQRRINIWNALLMPHAKQVHTHFKGWKKKKNFFCTHLNFSIENFLDFLSILLLLCFCCSSSLLWKITGKFLFEMPKQTNKMWFFSLNYLFLRKKFNSCKDSDVHAMLELILWNWAWIESWNYFSQAQIFQTRISNEIIFSHSKENLEVWK